MRILYVIYSMNPVMGGLPKCAASLAAAMTEHAGNVALLYYAGADQEARIQAAYGALPGFPAVQKIALPPPALGEYLFSRAALRAVRGFAPDVVHTHGLWEPLLRNSQAWAGAHRVPCVIMPHSMLHPWQNRRRRLAKWILQHGLGWRRHWQKAAFWQALTPSERGDLEAQAVAGRIEVVPNGIFPGELPPASAPAAFAVRFPSLAGRPYLLSMARLDPQKAPDVLLEAFALCAHELSDHCLVFAGPDYGMEASLRKRASALGLQSRVVFTGELVGPAKWEALDGAAVFCLPSRAEGFSMALAEAAARGLPMIVSPECGLEDFERAGAVKVASVDPPSLARALVDVAGNSWQAARMGVAAKSHLMERYTWPVVSKRLFDLYRQLPVVQMEPRT